MCVVSGSNQRFLRTHSAWDPTELIATRPLFTQRGTGYKFFYTCDGNKNVSELVHFESRNGIAAHYDYAPFGAITRAISASTVTDNTFSTDNPFRFSSEYHDDTLGLVYYNYRHYNPTDGRWCGRDPIEDLLHGSLFLENNSMCQIDLVGLQTCETTVQAYVEDYLFAITTGTYQKIEASVNEIVQNGMFSLFKEQLKAKSPFNKDVISKIEKEFKRYNKWERFGGATLFFGTTAGPYIKSWRMNVKVLFVLMTDCENIPISTEDFSASEDNLVCYVFRSAELKRFAESVASGAADIVNSINQRIIDLWNTEIGDLK